MFLHFSRLMVFLNSHEAMRQAFVKQGEDFSHRPGSRLAELDGQTDGAL